MNDALGAWPTHLWPDLQKKKQRKKKLRPQGGLLCRLQLWRIPWLQRLSKHA